jgi:tRNA pseudouridine38-40 synthase
MRYFIKFSYKGTNYHGWQIQPNDISVQSVLTDAMSLVFRFQVELTGAGRTDAGVHAVNMIAHFDLPFEIEDSSKIVYRLNSLLPKDISIDSIFEVEESMHARFSAKSRTYKYYVSTKKSPFDDEFSARITFALDEEKMNEAAQTLFDYIDFTSFSKLHTDVKTNNCRIIQAGWKQEGDTWVFTVQADRFLRNMVRAIVGTLLEVGRGKLTIDGFRKVIEAKDRGKAGTSVPGHALYLVNVTYPEDIFIVENN